METFKPPFTVWEIASGIIGNMIHFAVELWPLTLLAVLGLAVRVWWCYEHPRPSGATLRAVGGRRRRRWR
jgi:hypothetical protein